MWCRSCHQEVAGIPSRETSGKVCARCSQPLERFSGAGPIRRPEPVSKAETATTETAPGPIAPPIPEKLPSPTASLAALDREIDAVEAILKSWSLDAAEEPGVSVFGAGDAESGDSRRTACGRRPPKSIRCWPPRRH